LAGLASRHRGIPAPTTERLTKCLRMGIINHMVDEELRLDAVFHALADPTRRAILQRLAVGDALVKDLAEPFAMSKQAVSKHLNVLEVAGLIEKEIEGRSTRVKLRPEALRHVEDWVSFYDRFWSERIDRLKDLLKEGNE
jgi:DNA-binding transcriptional ArsR family regulator